MPHQQPHIDTHTHTHTHMAATGARDAWTYTLKARQPKSVQRVWGDEMDSCWQSLPHALFYFCVLPHCDMDTRRAFKMPPGKLRMPRMIARKLEHFISWHKQTCETSVNEGIASVKVPIWQPHEMPYESMPSKQLWIDYGYNSWLNHRYGHDKLFINVSKVERRGGQGPCLSYATIARVLVPPISVAPRPGACPPALPF